RVLPEAREVEGAARIFGTFSGRHGGEKVYFVARSSHPIASFATWQSDAISPGQLSASGDDVGVDLTLASDQAKGPVELKLAISYVSLKNARANLEADAGSDHFDAVLDKARRQWEEKLSLVRIEGGSDVERRIFYSGLYHALQMPTAFNDVNGEY